MKAISSGVITALMSRFIQLFIMSVLSLPVLAQDLSAFDVVNKADKKFRGISSYNEASLEIIRPTWRRKMSMKGWNKGRDYSLILITAPAHDKGSTSLRRNNEMWNWIPAIERVIKISPSMLSQSWMGSDFSNDDLINQSSILVDYTHQFAEDQVIDDAMCWQIIATPKIDAPVVWGKILLWISKTEFNQRQVAYYDEYGGLINTLYSHQVKTFDGRNIPTIMEMSPHDEPGNKTVMTIHDARFDFLIETDFFSLEQMKKVR